MIELFTEYNFPDIVAFLVTFSLALKGCVTFWDWGYDRLKKIFNKQSEEENEKQKIYNKIIINEHQIKNLSERLELDNEKIEQFSHKIDLLIKSDKDSIKSYIVKEHHYFIELGWIDDFSLDCIERRFTHYQEEGGNSFIAEMMADLRKLPNKPVSN